MLNIKLLTTISILCRVALVSFGLLGILYASLKDYLFYLKSSCFTLIIIMHLKVNCNLTFPCICIYMYFLLFSTHQVIVRSSFGITRCRGYARCGCYVFLQPINAVTIHGAA